MGEAILPPSSTPSPTPTPPIPSSSPSALVSEIPSSTISSSSSTMPTGSFAGSKFMYCSKSCWSIGSRCFSSRTRSKLTCNPLCKRPCSVRTGSQTDSHASTGSNWLRVYVHLPAQTRSFPLSSQTVNSSGPLCGTEARLVSSFCVPKFVLAALPLAPLDASLALFVLEEEPQILRRPRPINMRFDLRSTPTLSLPAWDK